MSWNSGDSIRKLKKGGRVGGHHQHPTLQRDGGGGRLWKHSSYKASSDSDCGSFCSSAKAAHL